MPVEVHDDDSGAVQLTILGSALLAAALLAALYAAGAAVALVSTTALLLANAPRFW